jgi:hypothetical protein
MFVLSWSISAVAAEFTYTESDSSGNNVALGYPVPTPVNSLTPVDGFRSYDSLDLRHQQLTAQSPLITRIQAGITLNNRAIWAYQLSDIDSLTIDGEVEGSALINGGIHAREWQTPEAVTGYMELFSEHQADQHIYQYVLENLNLVLIPVLNIDGFRQTQRFANKITQSAEQPRDGRMRRKNMRDVDESLSSLNDNLQGIDLNRNNNPYWASNSDRSSSDIDSIVHHGSSAGSEPEIQALQQGAVIAGEDNLRFYTDTHSFTQVYFAPMTGNASRDALTGRWANIMRAVNGFKYRYSPSSAGRGIGATDEYFANTYQIPSYTLEVEPANSAQEYGGIGVSHDGFILPNSEVARMRNETGQAALAGLYTVTGIPHLNELIITDKSSGNVISHQQWQKLGGGRTLNSIVTGELNANAEYQVTLVFNKPMRALENDGVVDYSTLSNANDMSLTWQIRTSDGESSVAINVDNGAWLTQGFTQYKTDTYQIDVTMPAGFDWAATTLLSLNVTTTDMTGQGLDTNPSTLIGWQNGGWTNYEDVNGNLASMIGGPDKSMRLIDDGSDLYGVVLNPDPTPTPTPERKSSSGGASFILLVLLSIITIRRRTPS